MVCGGATSGAEWSALARRAEDLGYDVVLSSDHLDQGGAHFSTLAAMPSLAAAAVATERVSVGTSVINMDLHHPAVLAREAATVDILSDGRLELGLGAGWAEYEYDWAGITYDPIGVRISRFAEYVQVVRGLLENDVFSFAGEYFTITDMPGVPRPVQRPRPPIMIGGTFKRMLSLAAREADIVSINMNGPVEATPAAMDERLEWVRDAAGARFDGLELSNIIGTLVVSEGDRLEVLRGEIAVQKAAGNDFMTAMLTEDQLLEAPSALIGSVGRIAEDIQHWRDRWGITYVIVTYPELERFAPVIELLKGE